MTCSHCCRLPTPMHTPQKVKFACLLIYPRSAELLKKSPPELLAFLSCPAASEDQSIIRPPPLPANTHKHTRSSLFCFSSLTSQVIWPSWVEILFFFFWLARGFSSELLSLLLTVIHFINSCLHATLQHCFWTCSDNQIYSPGPEVTHKQGGCVVFVAGSHELGETQRDSPGLFISLSPITCAWVLHVEFLTVLNGIKDDECGN